MFSVQHMVSFSNSQMTSMKLEVETFCVGADEILGERKINELKVHCVSRISEL